MPDREKVIEALETCRDQDNPPGYRFTSCVDDCPYHGNGCARKLKEDAIALLKEQKELVRCSDCRHADISPSGLIKCRGIFRSREWYCADGERK